MIWYSCWDVGGVSPLLISFCLGIGAIWGLLKLLVLCRSHKHVSQHARCKRWALYRCWIDWQWVVNKCIFWTLCNWQTNEVLSQWQRDVDKSFFCFAFPISALAFLINLLHTACQDVFPSKGAPVCYLTCLGWDFATMIVAWMLRN